MEHIDPLDLCNFGAACKRTNAIALTILAPVLQAVNEHIIETQKSKKELRNSLVKLIAQATENKLEFLLDLDTMKKDLLTVAKPTQKLSEVKYYLKESNEEWLSTHR